MLTIKQKNQIEETLEFQSKLNLDTNGENWESGFNKYGKEINWLRCIHMEIAELIDSTPWKHWKNIKGESDIDNIHVELVDIWHFLASQIVVRGGYSDLIKYVNLDYIPNENFDYKAVIGEAEEVGLLALMTSRRGESNFESILVRFFNLCKLSGLSFDDLYKIYFAKNALNKFRQDNGYKEGVYEKEWGGKEDNVYMLDAVKEVNSSIGGERIYNDIYSKLEELYPQ